MIRHSKKDANHNAIVGRFQDLGCTVAELHGAGIAGFPDLVVGVIGRNFLVEIKNPETAYGRSGFNPNQSVFARDWRGAAVIHISTVDEATAVVQNWRRAA
jgi:hypothetical protein